MYAYSLKEMEGEIGLKQDFVKVLAAVPQPSDGCQALSDVCAEAVISAADSGAALVVLPELCLAEDICSERFLDQDALDGIWDELKRFMEKTAFLPCVCVVGLPLCHEGKLYDCAAVTQGGMLLGLVPKTHIPRNQENAYFTPAPKSNLTYEFEGNYIQLGVKQIFVHTGEPAFRFCVELGEDGDMMISPATYSAMAGATMICHPTIQETPMRRLLLTAQSHRLSAAYLSAPREGASLIAIDGVASDRMAENVPLSALAYARRQRDTFVNEMAGEYTEVYFDLNFTPLTIDTEGEWS